jgi:hypothetical protein
MKIWINRAGQNLGTFTLEEIQRGLEQGIYLPSDLAWQEGMETWRPLSAFPGITIPAAAPDLPAPVPDVVAVNEPGAPPLWTQRSPVVAELVEDQPAWESRHELGFVKALFATWKGVLFNPGATFERMKSSGGYGSPLLFQFVMMLISFSFTVIYYLVQMAVIGSMAGSSNSFGDTNTVPKLLGGGVVMIFLVILGVVLGLGLSIGLQFVSAGITHLCLSLFKGTSKPYEATYRTLCYASSAYVFSLIPCVGSSIAGIWSLIVVIIGLSKVHKTEGWRAACAVLLPFVVCVGLLLVSYGVIVAALFSAGHNTRLDN